MIEGITTGIAGQLSSINRVESVRPVKQQEQEQKQESMDSVSLSDESVERYSQSKVKPSSGSENSNAYRSNPELSEDEKKKVEELKKRDKEVRAHEQAHMTAGAPYTSAPSYEYETGPDKQQYAIGGQVDVDTSEASTPEETIRKAQIIKRSASAPAEPSAQDRKVAAQAAQMEQSARAEKQQKDSDNSFGNMAVAAYAKTAAPTAGAMVNFSF